MCLKGTFYSFFHHFRKLKVKNWLIRDYVAFYGVTENFCFQKSLTEGKFFFNCKVLQKQKSEAMICKGDNFFRIFQKFFEEKNFYIWASQSSSNTLDLLRIKIQLNLFSKTWIDIVISERNVTRNVGMTLKESVSLPFNSYHLKNIGYYWNHFILLKLEAKLTNSERFTLRVKLKSCFDGLQNHGKLSWSSDINFSFLSDFKIISLPGRIYKGTFVMSNTLADDNVHLKNNSLHLVWLQDSFDYSNVSSEINENCLGDSERNGVELDSLLLWRCMSNSSSAVYQKLLKCIHSIFIQNISPLMFKCFNYKIIRQSKVVLHYIIISNILHNMDNKFVPSKVSWIEATKMCRKEGVMLPYFTSRQDLDQLIQVLKLSRHGFFLEGLYIGLVYNPNIDKVKLSSTLYFYLRTS